MFCTMRGVTRNLNMRQRNRYLSPGGAPGGQVQVSCTVRGVTRNPNMGRSNGTRWASSGVLYNEGHQEPEHEAEYQVVKSRCLAHVHIESDHHKPKHKKKYQPK